MIYKSDFYTKKSLKYKTSIPSYAPLKRMCYSTFRSVFTSCLHDEHALKTHGF